MDLNERIINIKEHPIIISIKITKITDTLSISNLGNIAMTVIVNII